MAQAVIFNQNFYRNKAKKEKDFYTINGTNEFGNSLFKLLQEQNKDLKFTVNLYISFAKVQ